MEVVAKAKYVRRTPRKARLVADAVIGMRVSEALAQLEFSTRHAAQDVAKVIKSAAANAEHNYNLSRDDLVVKQLLVDEGPTMKRFRPVSRGMAHQYFHRTSHITAVVEDRPAPPVTRRPERRRRQAAEPEQEAPKASSPRRRGHSPQSGDPNAVAPKAPEVPVEAAEPVIEAIEEPEAVEPEAVEPEAVEPEAVEPEAVEPEAVEPEAEAINPEETSEGEES